MIDWIMDKNISTKDKLTVLVFLPLAACEWLSAKIMRLRNPS